MISCRTGAPGCLSSSGSRWPLVEEITWPHFPAPASNRGCTGKAPEANRAHVPGKSDRMRQVGYIPGPVHSLFAVLCALALAAILISPAVPSPPTLVGKAVHAAGTVLAVAVMPPTCRLPAIASGIGHLLIDLSAAAGESVAGLVFSPLRR